jgi:hypothetical protein
MNDFKYEGDGEMSGQFLNEAEEQWIGTFVRNAMKTKPSVPPSSPCPAPEIIRALAFHHELDAAVVKEAALHTAECYDCAMLAEKYVNEYREMNKENWTAV